MPNGKCRLHGGKSTGPGTIEGIERIRAARTTHGYYTAEMIELRRQCAEARRPVRALVRAME
jgi:hypothetical protein